MSAVICAVQIVGFRLLDHFVSVYLSVVDDRRWRAWSIGDDAGLRAWL